MVMSEQFEEFRGSVGLTFEESEPWWPLLPEHEHGPRPNVLIILFDDMGFAHLGCYGSTIDTPTSTSWPTKVCVTPTSTSRRSARRPGPRC